MSGPFSFEDGGRTYTCTVEARRTPPTGVWWWFAVTGDGQRYAPFEVARGDTENSVRARILAYYRHLLVRRAEPYAPRGHWARRGRPPKAPEPTKD